MEPLITIITVSFNCSDTIERTIKSVLTQDYSNYRYIVVDGRSTDGTYDAINKYKESLYKFVSEPDEGMYYAMNKGIDLVDEGFILFLNGDDYLVDDNVLSRMAGYLTSDDAVTIGRIIYGNKKTEVVESSKKNSRYYDVFYPHQGMFIPRKLFTDIGGYDTSYKISADFEWICRAQYSGCKVNWIDETVSVFALDGRSNSLHCVIDEYNISKKYMVLTKDKCIEDMTNKTVEKALTYFFRLMILDDKYDDSFNAFFSSVGITEGDEVQIWGAGFWAQLFIDLFEKQDINVSYVFDKYSTRKEICGVPITPYNAEYATKLFISTETFDSEIAEFLSGENYIEGKDYVTFHGFRNVLLKSFDRDNDVYKDFVAQTGLYVLEGKL